MKTYVDIIRELREDRDLTQKEVAQYLGTTQQVYSRYENGENELPVHAPASAEPQGEIPLCSRLMSNLEQSSCSGTVPGG